MTQNACGGHLAHAPVLFPLGPVPRSHHAGPPFNRGLLWRGDHWKGTMRFETSRRALSGWATGLGVCRQAVKRAIGNPGRNFYRDKKLALALDKSSGISIEGALSV